MSGEKISIWDDLDVKEAFKDGRMADDIYVLNCPRCGRFGYYNQGNWFFCKHCEVQFYARSEYEEPPDDIPYVILDDVLTMDDVAAAECEDY